jgi:hypothetical protein
VPCEVMDRCHAVSEFLLDKSLDWLEGSELE